MVEQYEVIIQPTDDPNTRAFHTRSQLTELPCEEVFRNQPSCSAIAQLFIDIDGVQTVRVFPYFVLVNKGLMFEWKAIELTVQNILCHLAKSSKLLTEDFSIALSDRHEHEGDRVPRPKLSGPGRAADK